MIHTTFKVLRLVFILIFILSCAKNGQKTIPHDSRQFSIQKKNTIVEEGMIYVKFKHEIKFDSGKNGRVVFDIMSLDQLSEKYQIVDIKPVFKKRPILKDTTDVHYLYIYQLIFLKSVRPPVVARPFSGDSHVEYAEPVPVMKLDKRTPIEGD